MALTFIKRFLDSRQEAAAKRAEFDRVFNAFIAESSSESTGADDYKIYRHAWRRAVIISRFYEINENAVLADLHRQIALRASNVYHTKAPDGLYGKPKLKIGDRVWKQMVEVELRKLVPEQFAKLRERPLACIYMGKRDQGRIYVGQTVGAPEIRWVQHRIAGTGPFKEGEKYVAWVVLEREVQPTKLNEREAYYIGLYNADKHGYNETAGNSRDAYQRGREDRARLGGPK